MPRPHQTLTKAKKMKNFIRSLILLALTTPAMAAEKYVCIEYSRSTDMLKQNVVVLTPAGRGVLRDGGTLAYTLEAFKGADTAPVWEISGIVSQEDVSFGFESNDGKTKFHIYLDELNESSLSISGHSRGSYICR